MAAYREQMVEITLGPKGAFENANIGALTRRVARDSAVIAIPPRRGLPKAPKETRTPRVVAFLRKAIEWQALLESGEFTNQGHIAIREGITRARVNQIMGLLRLAPEIRQLILSQAKTVSEAAITERALRPITYIENWRHQTQLFDTLLSTKSSGIFENWKGSSA
jgi:hypothetical protein